MQACQKCGEKTEKDVLGGIRAIHLENGICFHCTAEIEGWTIDPRSRLDIHLDELAEGGDSDAKDSNV